MLLLEFCQTGLEEDTHDLRLRSSRIITVRITLKGRDREEVLAAIDQLRLMLANRCLGGWFRLGEENGYAFSEFQNAMRP